MKRTIIAGMFCIVLLNAYSQSNSADRNCKDSENIANTVVAKTSKETTTENNAKTGLEDRQQVKAIIYKKDSNKQELEQSVKNNDPEQTKRQEDSYLHQEEQ